MKATQSPSAGLRGHNVLKHMQPDLSRYGSGLKTQSWIRMRVWMGPAKAAGQDPSVAALPVFSVNIM